MNIDQTNGTTATAAQASQATVGVNPILAQGITAAEQGLVNDAVARKARAAKIKAGAIGTAKAVGYMAAGAAVTVGVYEYQKRRNQNQGQNQDHGGRSE